LFGVWFLVVESVVSFLLSIENRNQSKNEKVYENQKIKL